MIGKEFVMAGRAIFTIQNASGVHKTFKVTRSKPSPRFPRPAYFVSVLTGRDNETSYTYLGRLDPETGTLETTARSTFYSADEVFRIAQFALRVAYGRQALPTGYDLRHSGKCGRCGRTLTHPESLDNGIGPECIKMIRRPATPSVANEQSPSLFV